MTVPDATPEGRSCEVVTLADGTAEDALARVVRRHRLLRVTGGTAVGSTWVCACSETVRTPGVTRDWAETLHARHAAAAVVAAIRAMSVEQQAQLLDGYVQKALATAVWRDGHAVPARRVVGPWQETP